MRVQWTMVLLLIGAGLLVLGLLAPPRPTHAQSNEQVEAAIAALNEIIPGIGEPNEFSYTFQPVNNSNLGCPLVAGEALSSTITAYRVSLRYGSTTYVVYVSQDLSRVVPCDNVPNESPQSPTTPTATAAPRLNCLLSSSQNAFVRTQPSQESGLIIGTVPNDRVFQVLQQSPEPTWYLIQYTSSQTGWVGASVAEVSGSDCAVIPIVEVEIEPAIETTIIPSATATLRPIITASPNAATQSGDCSANATGYLPTRLALEDGNALIEAGAFLTLRAEARGDSQALGTIGASEGSVELIEGPVCFNGIVWWLVGTENLTGWVPESSFIANRYFLAPIVPAGSESEATPPSTENGSSPNNSESSAPSSSRLSPDDVASLALLRRLPLFTVDHSALALSASRVAVISGEGVRLYSYPDLQPLPQLTAALAVPTTENTPTALAFDRFDDFLLIGYESGALDVLELEQGILIPLPSPHQAPISSISFSPENDQVLTTSGLPNGITATASFYEAVAWDLSSFDAVTGNMETLFTVEFSGPIQASAYTPGGVATLLAYESLTVAGTDENGSSPDAITLQGARLVILNQDGSIFTQITLEDAGSPSTLIPAPERVVANDSSVILGSANGTRVLNIFRSTDSSSLGSVEGYALQALSVLRAEDFILALGMRNDEAGAIVAFLDNSGTVLRQDSFGDSVYGVAFGVDGSHVLILQDEALVILGRPASE